MDIALAFQNNIFDISEEPENGIRTAIIISLFTDKRINENEKPSDESSLAGFWGDDFEERPYGSRLWLLHRNKINNETRLNAIDYAKEALEWLTEDKVVKSVNVDAQIIDKKIALLIGIELPGNKDYKFRFTDVTNYERNRDQWKDQL
ncbi:phage GP46 family protein [Halobacteriovorax sp. GB3]|uniref:phage GP46 family protein n=1 Tax=Halobacteriovorax sp. GB3 TaxID=2719615 RepID=UPI00235FD4AD|nr:phage GP46 family protein [Halobacteriovorax sp. GB3]MDD0853001.1 phage GP46 family protein [Halobacteriovorax sp. GB3]